MPGRMPHVQAANSTRQVDEHVPIHILDKGSAGSRREYGSAMKHSAWDGRFPPSLQFAGMRPGDGSLQVYFRHGSLTEDGDTPQKRCFISEAQPIVNGNP